MTYEMEECIILLFPVLIPMIAGILVLTVKAFRNNRKLLIWTVMASLTAGACFIFTALFAGGGLTLWHLTDSIAIAFRVDGISCLFATLTAVVWFLVGLYSITYMTHEEEEYRFFGFYLIVLGVLVGLDFSANLVTMYVFFELMTLTSLPLVLHEKTRDAVMAGLKYLFYSVAGAFLALFGILFLASVTPELSFAPGGILKGILPDGKNGILLAAVCCMLIGFGTKAGMFPMHGWLPTAHPAAPAPASAVLSGLITKSGVLAVIRVVYYIVGPELLRGTWVQDVWILLSLLTVFMGSMLAYREPVMKKRLAYSTVSQVSYILFGLSLMQPAAFVGALSHIVFHSFIKNGLFLVAGAVIFKTGWRRVEEMRGLGQIMPVTLGCYTVLSLALVGIPPASGFVSKWYLATGALASGTGVWELAGPVILLISALLTAGYLLPVSISGFFPGADFDGGGRAENPFPIRLERKGPELSWQMLVPVALFTAGALLFGCFPGGLISALKEIAAAVL